MVGAASQTLFFDSGLVEINFPASQTMLNFDSGLVEINFPAIGLS